MLDGFIVGIVCRSRPSYGVEGFTSGIGDQMHVKELAGLAVHCWVLCG